jgi:hypothetical protein
MFHRARILSELEEAWSEIDHRVRYPSFSDDRLLAAFLLTFNRVAGTADEMGSFVHALASALADFSRQRAATEAEIVARLKVIELPANVTESEATALSDAFRAFLKAYTAASVSSTVYGPIAELLLQTRSQGVQSIIELAKLLQVLVDRCSRPGDANPLTLEAAYSAGSADTEALPSAPDGACLPPENCDTGETRGGES